MAKYRVVTVMTTRHEMIVEYGGSENDLWAGRYLYDGCKVLSSTGAEEGDEEVIRVDRLPD